jgi:hypothetical protein
MHSKQPTTGMHGTRQQRRRAMVAVGLIYFIGMVALDAIARSGIAEGIPILGWGEQGPFTSGWFAGHLIKHSIATAIFVFILSRVIPARSLGQETA